ncbi:MAG: DUF1015 family protein [Bariatricus sp.]|nr:DUF1015 family protein [Bariatricus sp.]
MAKIRAFKGVRPAPEYAKQIAALPYDVYCSSEAREIVEKNPLSFLKIDRAETQFPEETDMYSEEVYEKARDTYREMKEEGKFIQDEMPCLYLYELTMEGRRQRGIMCCASVDDYLNQVIKKHENTREEKEIDRINHVDVLSAHTGPIFLAYRSNEGIREKIEEAVSGEPIYDFNSDDGIGHRVWKIEEEEWNEDVCRRFAEIESLYIADGHHRAASAVKVAQNRRLENPNYTGEEEFNYFLAVLFDEEELKIYDYNRVVHKVSGEIIGNLPEILKGGFKVKYAGKEEVHPSQKGEIAMYLKEGWYLLQTKSKLCPEDVVKGLDVSILQNCILAPVLGIDNPKTDERIQFVGGIRGLGELMKIVDSEENAVAFAMFPTSLKELFAVADEGRLMPPKSTWFEPKPRSGLFIHEF